MNTARTVAGRMGRNDRRRANWLVSACMILAPGVAHAQTVTDVKEGKTQKSTVVMGGSDQLIVEKGGAVSVTSDRAVNFKNEPSGDGPVIDNAGTIEAMSTDNARAIDIQAASNTNGRNFTIINRDTGIIQAATDAIRLTQTTDVTLPSVIRIDNSGTIVGNSGAGIQITNIPSAKFVLTNAAGATIQGSARGINAISGDIANAGSIIGGQDAIRLTGPGDSTVTLLAGSTTSGATGSAVSFASGGTHTLNIEVGATLVGSLKGSAGGAASDILNLGGSGEQTLVAIANFDVLNVNSGSWAFDGIANFDDGATIASGATLRLIDGAGTSGAVNGAIVDNGELVFARSGVLTQDGIGDDGITPLTSSISGSGIVRIANAAGTYAFSQQNSYSGATFIDAGTLRADGAGTLSAASAVTIAAGGVLDINGFDNSIADLSGAGEVRTGDATGGILTTGAAGGDTEFSGGISGNGGLTKVGSGTLTLSGANAATGLVQATEGAIALSGSWAGSAGASNGGMLTGSGSVAGVTTVGDGGILAPGHGVGTFTTGGLVLSSGSHLAFELGTPGNPAASDRIQVNGNLTLGGTLDVTDVGGFGEGVYRLIDYTGALIDNGLAVGTLPGGTDPGSITIQTGVTQQVNLVYRTPDTGALQFWDGAGPASDDVIAGGSGIWGNAPTNWTDESGTVNSGWSGQFAVFQGIAGTVSVIDDVTFTGMQFMTDGYLVTGDGGSLTTDTAASGMRVDPGVTATIAASIGGTGGLNKLDSGTLILSGTNSYAGATTISGGTLRVLGGSAIPVSSAVTVASGATLDLAADQAIGSLAGAGSVTLSGGSLIAGGNGADTSFSGVISGAGGFAKAGAGVTTLSGVNNYAGSTVVTGGTLRLAAGARIGSGDLVMTGGAIELGGNATSVGAISGSGGIDMGASGSLTTTSAADSEFAGTIQGTGAVLTKAGSGTLTLSGANSYDGGTIVNGGTLVVANAGALANTGAVTVNAGGTIDFRTDKTIGALAGVGTITLGASRVTVSTGASTEFAGVAAGTGGFNKAGTGTLILSGTNTYTGRTTATRGTVLVNGSIAGNATAGDGATIGGTGTIARTLTVNDGGTVAAGANGVGTLTVGGLVLSGGSHLAYDLGSPNVAGASDRIQVNGDLTLDGTLDVKDVGGFGDGVYRLIDYTGALTDNGLAVGNLPDGYTADEAQVQTSTDHQVNLVVAGKVSDVQFWDGGNTVANGAIEGGSGSWTNGATDWTGANGGSNHAWGGKFAVFQGAAGTVTVDDAIGFTGMQFMTDGYGIAAGSGALTTDTAAAGMRVDPGVTATIAAAIGGSGGLNKLDSGTLILSGVNSYAGATTVSGGRLRVTVTGALPQTSAVAVASGATLDIGANQTVASLAGAGNITLTGGSLTAGGDNSSTTFSGVMSGSGGFTKAGSGTMTLTGKNSYTGPTDVTGGVLVVNGSIASAVTLGAGAELMGSGQIGSLTVTGRIAPGNSIGTLAVNGALTFAKSSVYEVQVSPTAADRINASGAATIDGGTVSVLAGSGTYSPVTDYTIITGGSITGTFDSVTSDMAFLVPFLSYSATAVYLRMVRNDVSFASIGQTPNQRAVGAALETPLNGTLFDTIVGLDADRARRGFDLLAGELHADLLSVASRDAMDMRDRMIDRLQTPGKGVSLWLDGRLASAGTGATANNAKVDASRYNVGGGIEYGFTGGKIGIAGYRGSTDVGINTLGASGNVETYSGALYAGGDWGVVHVRVGGGYAFHRLKGDRDLLIGSFTDTLSSRENGHTIQSFGEIAFDAYTHRITLQPFVGGAVARTTLDGTTEQGGAAALDLSKVRYDASYVTAGARLFGPLAGNALRFNLEVAGKQMLQGNYAVRNVRFADTGSAFAVRGADWGKAGVGIRAGISVPVGGLGELSVQATGDATQEAQDYGAHAQFGVRF